MKITIAMVVDLLKTVVTTTSMENEKSLISEAKNTHNLKHADSGIVYIADSEQLDSIRKCEIIANLVYILAEDEVEPLLHNVGNILYVHKVSTVQTLVKRINKSITKMHQWADELLYSTIEDKGIQEIIEIAGKQLVNPLLVFDTSFKVLGFSKELNRDDFFDAGLKERYIALNEAQYEEMKKFNEYAIQRKNPEIFRFNHLQYRFLHINIAINNIPSAFYEMIEQEETITTGQIHIAEYVCQMLSLELQKREMSESRKDKMYEYFFKDILTNPNLSAVELKKRFSYLFHGLHEHLIVLAIEQVRPLNHTTAGMSTFVPYFLENHIHFTYEHYTFLFIDSKETSPFNEYERQQLIQFLDKNGLAAGLSDTFPDITGFREAYRQATKALQLYTLEERQPIQYYADYRLVDFIDQVASQVEDVENYYNPGLMELMRTDRQYNGELAKTLFFYIKNNNNQKATAQELNIHRSTLIYRIHKIEEQLGLDVNDSDIVFHMKLTFMLLGNRSRDNQEPWQGKS